MQQEPNNENRLNELLQQFRNTDWKEIARILNGVEQNFSRIQTVFQQTLDNVQPDIRRMRENFQQIGQNSQKAVETLRLAGQQFIEGLRKVGPTIRFLLDRMDLFDAMDRSEWLPHDSSPIHLISNSGDDWHELDRLIQVYYENNWDEVVERLQERSDSYDLNCETKSTFKEAIAAHAAGFYRSVVRLLIPEMERLMRVEFEAPLKDRMTSQRDLIKAAKFLTNQHFDEIGLQGLKLLQRLSSHLYEKVETPEAYKRFVDHGIPNRHAALHGLIAYNTQKNSLNTILMMDYVMQIVDLAKRKQQSSNSVSRAAEESTGLDQSGDA